MCGIQHKHVVTSDNDDNSNNNNNNNNNRDLSFAGNIDNRIPNKCNAIPTEILTFVAAISVHVLKIMELGTSERGNYP